MIFWFTYWINICLNLFGQLCYYELWLKWSRLHVWLVTIFCSIWWTCWVHFKYLLLILNSPWKTKWFPQMKDILKMTAFHTDNVVLLAVCQYQTISTFFFYLAVKDTCSRLALLCCQRIEFLSCFMSCHWSNCSFQGKLQDSSSVFGLFFLTQHCY